MIQILGKIVTALFVFVFGVMWYFSTKSYERPQKYDVVIYDVFGKQVTIDGLRTSFNTILGAERFIEDYHKRFPQYSFAHATFIPKIKPTMIQKILQKN